MDAHGNQYVQSRQGEIPDSNMSGVERLIPVEDVV